MEENLKIRARQQLERLVSQLSDLESIKNDLDSEEYEDAKSETLDQLQEFEKSLNKLDCGEVTLEFTARAILTEAFRTPDIIKLFMSKRSDGLRQKLQEITRDNTIGKMGSADNTTLYTNVIVLPFCCILFDIKVFK